LKYPAPAVSNPKPWTEIENVTVIKITETLPRVDPKPSLKILLQEEAETFETSNPLRLCPSQKPSPPESRRILESNSTTTTTT
jgi:hypothetical protein